MINFDKLLGLIIIFIYVISIAACTDDERAVRNSYTGKSTANLNGTEELWESKTLVRTAHFDSERFWIECKMENNRGQLRQFIMIGAVRAESQRIIPYVRNLSGNFEERVAPNVSFSTWVSDGDVVCHKFQIDTTYHNFILIDEFNPDNYRIRGRYDLRFIRSREDNCSDSTVLDTMHFANGILEVNGLTSF